MQDCGDRSGHFHPFHQKRDFASNCLTTTFTCSRNRQALLHNRHRARGGRGEEGSAAIRKWAVPPGTSGGAHSKVLVDMGSGISLLAARVWNCGRDRGDEEIQGIDFALAHKITVWPLEDEVYLPRTVIDDNVDILLPESYLQLPPNGERPIKFLGYATCVIR